MREITEKILREKSARLAIPFAALLLAGCISMGRKLDQDKVSQIKKGDTRNQVVSLIGSPDHMTSDGNGNTTFSYSYMRVTSHAANFIPIIGPLVGGHDVQNQMVIINFSTNDVVSNIITSYGATESGNGVNTGGHVKLDDVEKNKRPQ